jgi:hypothetical protein
LVTGIKAFVGLSDGTYRHRPHLENDYSNAANRGAMLVKTSYAPNGQGEE